MIYLDHNATTPLDARVREEMLGIGAEPFNPSSIHSFGRKGKSLIENARRLVKKMLDANAAYRIVFTSGGTEANNLLIKNFCKDGQDRILISAIEHASIYEQQNILPNIDVINVDATGILKLDELENKLANNKNYKLVSVMLANNETGIIQPIEKITKLTHKYGALMHSDATCATGKMEIDLQKLNVDFLSVSAHKFGGPKGVGALICKADIPVQAQIYGGKQEYGIRAGTENVEAIVGFGKAAELASTELKQRIVHMHNLQQKLEEELERNFAVKIIGKETQRLPNTTLIIAEGTDNQTTVINLDLKGVAVSSGSACSSGKIGASHVLKAMRSSEKQARSAIRISMGYAQKMEEIEEFIKICIDNKIFPKKH